MDEFTEPVTAAVVIEQTVELATVQIVEAIGFITLDDEERFEI
jgi:hypothetical protein